MRNAKYTVKSNTQFKKDYKMAMKRGLDIKLLEGVIADLAMGIPLPEKTGITPCPETGPDIVSAMCCPTGCLSTALTMMCWC